MEDLHTIQISCEAKTRAGSAMIMADPQHNRKMIAKQFTSSYARTLECTHHRDSLAVSRISSSNVFDCIYLPLRTYVAASREPISQGVVAVPLHFRIHRKDMLMFFA